MSVLKSNWGVGWTTEDGGIHTARLMKRVIIGDALGYLMNGTGEQAKRFASSVLRAIDFTSGALGERETSKGYATIHSTMEAADIDYIHRKFADEIYSKHLATPMSNDEFTRYITEETLRDNSKQQYLDLLEKDIHKAFDVRL